MKIGILDEGIDIVHPGFKTLDFKLRPDIRSLIRTPT